MILHNLALLSFAFIGLFQVGSLVSAESLVSAGSLTGRLPPREVRPLVRRGDRIDNGKWSVSFEDIGWGLCEDGTYSMAFRGNTLSVRFRNQDFVVVDNVTQVARCGIIAGALVRENEPTPKWHHDAGYLHDGTPKRRDVGSGSYMTIDLIPDPFTEQELQELAELESGNATSSGNIVRRQDGLVDKVSERLYVGITMWYANPGDTWRVAEFNLDFPE